MAENSTVQTESDRLELKTSLAPGHYFFCRRIVLPDDLEDSEIEGAVLLGLESISPFPLEHLNFGYAIDSEIKNAFVFAAYKRRFESAEISTWAEDEFVLPDFAYALVDETKAEESLIIVSRLSVSFFRFDEASNLPAYSQALAREDDEDYSNDIERLKQEAGSDVNWDQCRVLEYDGSTLEDRGKVRINATDVASQSSVSTIVDRLRIWQLDLRDPEIIETAKSEERRNYVLWNTVLGVAAVFALLLLGEVLFGVTYGYLSLRKYWNDEQAPIVAHVESQHSTVNQLLEFEESDLAPYEMLAAINPYKPASVQYSKIVTNGPTRLEITANASSVSDANQFKTRLERFSKIDTVLLENMRPLPGGATFTAILTFQRGAFDTIEDELKVDAEVASND